MNKKHHRTISEIIRTLLIGGGIVILAQALDLFKEGNYLGALILGAFGYFLIFMAVNQMRN